ncbi:uncharacterized protein tasor2 isoform X2 [Betta splendens]|uniref:Uncharacterized protein tasor2 isoform X2 n=1 Tax=Betta splendens TaxID=158456 RepID=A0A6P7MQ00_BETSP|nr:uncharacterized protein tasor2 isoform X2 [Betta splendens]
MESGNGGASSKGVSMPVSDRSDVFKDCILTPLESAYLYDESKQSFRYESAVLIKNPALEEKYNTFRAKRREIGYSDEDLKETYGFLLFDDVSKAQTLGETGVLTGNSTCTTLGDPAKGVYISMYSDCLDPNRWYHGKSGCIAIIRLTKGRVKRVFENYTQNFTAPSVGFDCHVSEHLPVSANTSSFLAFERTQYYMYELLDDGSNETAPAPSAACPFAIALFSYMDTKVTVAEPQEKRYFMQRTLFSFECCEEIKTVCHYVPWRGQLQIDTQFYNVGLKSTTKALFLPGKLPPLLKVDRAVTMLGLRQLLPRTVFETYFSGEVFLDGLYCSLCELVPSNMEETNSLTLLVQEVKEKELALLISLSDGGFLILLHSSHFLTYENIGSNATKVLQGLFVFPESRLIHRDTKFGDQKVAIPSEIHRILPALHYAEGEAEKTTNDPSEELCEVLARHMQNYAALINPGLALSPSRDVSVFPDQYDVANAHRHLYSTTEWTSSAWQNVRSYLSKPLSFQLPVAKASELLAAGHGEQGEEMDDDVYICLSSPEEVQASSVNMESDDHSTFLESPVNTRSCVDCSLPNSEAHIGLTAMPQKDEAAQDTKDYLRSDLTVLIKKDALKENLLNLPTSDDLPAELIVSITSAKRTATEQSLGSTISTVSGAKHNDFELSGFSPANLKTEGVKSLIDETVEMVNGDCSNLRKTRRGKVCRRRKRCYKTAPKIVEGPSVQTHVDAPHNLSQSQKDDLAKESSGHSQLSNPSGVDWRKLPRRRRKYGKVLVKNKKLRSSTVNVVSDITYPTTVTKEIEACTMRKKTERWVLKPVVSECGRILVPHGSVDFANQIRYLNEQTRSNKQDAESMLVSNATSTCMNLSDTSVHDIDEMEQYSSTAPQTVENQTDYTVSNERVDCLQNSVVSDDNPEHVVAEQLEGGNGSLHLNPEGDEHSSQNNGNETSSSEAVNETHVDRLFLGNCGTKSKFLLHKLKSVLLRGKRKSDALVSEGMTRDTAQDTDLSIKMGKFDSDTNAMKSNNSVASVRDSDKEPSEMRSLDPLFAYALGLTPKERTHEVQNTVSHNNQLGKDLLEKREQLVSDKQPQIIQKPPPIFQKRGRIKTLRRHQGIPAEYIKQKWWLHFQTPASFASEKLKSKDCTRDNSVRKTVKEKMNSSCTSTDALNLLADLALSATNGQVPQQPEPTLEKERETSSKNCDVAKDVTSAEQESVLHSLLRQPASRTLQPLESPSPSRRVAGHELLDLISEEHAYSLPQSSPLLLGLLGTQFQEEDRDEHNHGTPQNLMNTKKHVHRHKFKHSCASFNKDGSVQVTRQWKENYDFSLDSRFTSGLKEKTIIRALHGPWDVSIQDKTDEVRLLVHMWIGLFYSRSTARFFHIDSKFTHPCSEKNELLETLTGVTSAPAQLEFKESSLDQSPNISDISDSAVSKALDLSKKDTTVFDRGAVILDLSLRNPNAEAASSALQVNRKNTCVSSEKQDATETLSVLESFTGVIQEASTFQCYKEMAQSMESIAEVINAKDNNENKTVPLQRADILENMDVPSFKGHGSLISHPEVIESVSIRPENPQTVHGLIKEKTDRKDKIESSTSTEISLVLKHSIESKPATEKDRKFSKEMETAVHSTESKDETNSTMKESSSSDDNREPPKMINFGHNSACIEDCLENEEQLSREESESAQDQTKNIDEGVDCSTVKEDTIIKEDHSRKRGLDEQNGCISSVGDGFRLSDEPLQLIKKAFHTDCSHQDLFDAQPSQRDWEEDACYDLQMQNGSTNPQTLPAMEPVCSEVAGEENSERYICLMEKAGYQNSALPTSDENMCSLGETCGGITVDSLPQTKDNAEPGNNGFAVTNLRFGLGRDQEIKSTEERKDDAKIQLKFKETLTDEADFKIDETSEECGKSDTVVIPFHSIGINTTGVNIVQPHDSHPQGNAEQQVQDQIKIPIISETTSPTSQMHSEKTELFGAKIPLSDLDKTHQSFFLANESDDRCPTPTMDEKPYEYISDPKIRASNPVNDVIDMEQEDCHKSTGNNSPNSDCRLHSDLESRTQRVLKCIDMLLLKSDLTEKSSLQTAGINHNVVEIHKSSSKHIPTTFSLNQISTDCSQISNTMSDMASSFTCISQELLTTSSEHKLLSPFKAKLGEVLGVSIQLNKTNSSVPQHYFERTEKLQQMPVGQDYFPSKAFPSSACLQDIKPDINKHKQKTLQSSFNKNLRSYNENAIMAVKPSKSDESEGDQTYEDGQMENSPISKQIKNPIVSYNRNTSREKTETVKKYSEEPNDHIHDSSYVFSKRSPRVTASKSISTSTALLDCLKNDSPTLEPESSIMCTVYNNRQQKAYSFLEEISMRCLQNDLTQTSMEQEHLIFSEQMKQLFKKTKRRPVCDQDAHDKSKPCCSNHLIVQFSKLEEEDDSLDNLDEPLPAGQKIMVDMSDRINHTGGREGKTASHWQETGKQMEHAGVCDLTEECARLYEAKMNSVCAVKKVPPRLKFYGMDDLHQQTEPRNNFDFCDQMKREMDESFHSNLNSVVKKSCKTKYRFFILATSDDSFFKETKARMEAQGHTIMDPSEFFLGDGSSSLLIIVRNEDIAEHICEVPHLLKLKKSPIAQFAGVDEPDDVVNLTHQELFTRGGFIMFNRAVLESLKLCHLRKCSEILEELSKTGKWKWMLHYRDSRRLKENARLSAEAKQKTHFLNWCQDTGILEVLPYHDCDLLSQDQPDYLACLVHLQVHNISARYPVFITDKITDDAFGRNGIFTMAVKSFLTGFPGEIFKE